MLVNFWSKMWFIHSITLLHILHQGTGRTEPLSCAISFFFLNNCVYGFYWHLLCTRGKKKTRSCRSQRDRHDTFVLFFLFFFLVLQALRMEKQCALFEIVLSLKCYLKINVTVPYCRKQTKDNSAWKEHGVFHNPSKNTPGTQSTEHGLVLCVFIHFLVY